MQYIKSPVFLYTALNDAFEMQFYGIPNDGIINTSDPDPKQAAYFNQVAQIHHDDACKAKATAKFVVSSCQHTSISNDNLQHFVINGTNEYQYLTFSNNFDSI